MSEYFNNLIGKEINRTYRIEKLLGSGGMGSVFKAKHIHLGNDVAIKVLSPHFANDTSLIKRFQREAKVGWALTHPNIIKVSDFGKTDDGILFMVMEYVEGETMDVYLARSGPLPIGRVLQILEPLCDALSVAHDQNILHRDLKPANIMISTKKDQEVVKLLDFGIVKLLQPDEQVSALTAVGEVFGTPIYMAPEHLMGLQVGPTADVYSLGVITHLMLTGQLPHDSEDLRRLFEMKMKELPAPSQKYSFLPAGIDPILQKVLASHIDKRYQSVNEFFKALKKVADTAPTSHLNKAASASAQSDLLAAMPTIQTPSASSPIPQPTVQSAQTISYATQQREAAAKSGGGGNATPAAASKENNSPAPSSPPADPAAKQSNSTMMIIGAVVVLVIIAVVIFLATKK